MSKIFQVPSDGVLKISADSGSVTSVDQSYGYLNIIMDNVIYYRDLNHVSGLLHLVGSIDIELDREWYDKFAKAYATSDIYVMPVDNPRKLSEAYRKSKVKEVKV